MTCYDGVGVGSVEARASVAADSPAVILRAQIISGCDYLSMVFYGKLHDVDVLATKEIELIAFTPCAKDIIPVEGDPSCRAPGIRHNCFKVPCSAIENLFVFNGLSSGTPVDFPPGNEILSVTEVSDETNLWILPRMDLAQVSVGLS